MASEGHFMPVFDVRRIRNKTRPDSQASHCKALLPFHWQGRHALQKSCHFQGVRLGSSLMSRSNRRPSAVDCTVPTNRGPAMYIANEMSIKDLHPLVHSPRPYNLLIVSNLSEFVTVTFRKYCTKKENCTQ